MAEDLLRKEWETNYKSSTSISVQDPVVHFYPHHHMLPLTHSHGTQLPATKNRYFDDFDSFNATGTAHPVDEWLSSSPVAGADGL